MKTLFITIFALTLLFSITFLLIRQSKPESQIVETLETQSAQNQILREKKQVAVKPANNEYSEDVDTGLAWPISNPLPRIIKKPFGVKITPQDSPVTPERFSGFHTGTDFEVLPEEDKANVPVTAFCTGKILRKELGRGYGGMIVQACEIDTLPVVVTYGHLSLKSSTAEIGEQINTGQFLANLGEGFSSETDGERKHLHLGIYIGTGIVTSGYVSNANKLEQYLNIQDLLY